MPNYGRSAADYTSTTVDELSPEAVATPNEELRELSCHPSYHGTMTWRKAEKKLKAHGGNCYLTRYSKSQDTYRLSVIRRDRRILVKHCAIKIKTRRTGTTYKIVGTEKSFNSVSHMLHFYETCVVNHEVPDIGQFLRCDSDSDY